MSVRKAKHTREINPKKENYETFKVILGSTVNLPKCRGLGVRGDRQTVGRVSRSQALERQGKHPRLGDQDESH